MDRITLIFACGVSTTVTRQLIVAAAILAAAACAPEPPSADLDAERAALREADGRYTRLMTAKDAEGVSALYAPDATMYPPDGPTVSGLEAVRAFAAEFTGVPGLTIGSVRPLVVEVSRDGDLGYTINAVEMTVPDEAGNPVTERLRDVHLWRKQADGSWKVVVDVWNAEPPPAAAAAR
ncbi:MAG TPA: DUF4440 domain-containing protein [Vicinamibacterales bacterium]|nr:DUF4440 domain-containing protein [Vicinamibacterales bacterium]